MRIERAIGGARASSSSEPVASDPAGDAGVKRRPGLGWANGSDGGDGYGTHDWVIHEANRLSVLQGCEWANMASRSRPATIRTPSLADVVHHVYDVWGPSTYGDAPARIALLYQEAVRKLRAGDAAGASRSAGLLSHYYADICNPLHTDQATGEDAIHASYEDDVEALTDAVGENRAWLVFDGYQPVWDAAYKAARAAEKAHADYALLLQQYAAHGHDDAVDVITRRALNLAVNGLADILISIGRGRVRRPRSALRRVSGHGARPGVGGRYRGAGGRQ